MFVPALIFDALALMVDIEAGYQKRAAPAKLLQDDNKVVLVSSEIKSNILFGVVFTVVKRPDAFTGVVVNDQFDPLQSLSALEVRKAFFHRNVTCPFPF